MKRFILVIVSALCVDMSMAQSYMLNGHVYFQDKSHPLSYASVKNNSSHKVVLSDSVGHFEIQVSGNDSLTCSYIGCLDKVAPVSKRDVVDIYLNDASLTLEGVEIVGRKKPIQMSADGFVVNMNAINKDGKLFSDIMRQLPLVSVKNDVVSMAGKNSVIVYINHHKLFLKGGELMTYLNSLGLDNIRQIKVITTPPARYEAEGNVGIIEIETSRKLVPGLQAKFLGRGTIGHYLSYGGSAKLFYSGKRFSIETILLGSRASEYAHSRYTNTFADCLVSTDNPKKSTPKGVTAMSSLYWELNQRNKLSATLQLPLFNRTINQDLSNDTRYYALNNKEDSLMSSKGQGHSADYQYNFEVNYTCALSDKSNLNITLGYVNSYERDSRNWTSKTTKTLSTNEESFYSLGHQKNDIYTLKADFDNVLCNWKCSEGYKLSYVHTNSYNEEDSRLVADAASVNLFGYREYCNAFYANAERALGDLRLNVGLRAELTNTKGISYALNNINSNHYFKMFPVLGVEYSIDDDNTLNLNYSERVKRPGFRLLDPFRWYISKYDYSEGDPFLKPSYIHNVSFTCMHGSSLYAEMYFTRTNNDFGKMVILDSENIRSQIERAGNFLNISAFGANMEYNYQVGSWLESNLSGDVTYSRYASNQAAFKNATGWGGVFSMNNTFYLSKKIFSSLYVEDDVPGYYNYRKNKNSLLVNIGLAYADKKSGLMVSIKAEDLFKNADPKYCYYSNGIRQDFDNYYDTRYVEITLTKKFGTSFNKRKADFHSSNSEERDRL